MPADLGIASSVLDGNSTGNYAVATLNLELVAGNVYDWINMFIMELNKCINANIIKDKKLYMECAILPVTFVNRDKQVKYMTDLYARGKGSLTAWIASTVGIAMYTCHLWITNWIMIGKINIQRIRRVIP